jgi:hypothetical protein
VHGKGTAEGLQAGASAGQVFGVEVQGDQVSGRTDSAQQFGSMSGPADGAIHDDLAGLRVERGDNFLKQNGPMFPRRGTALAAGLLGTALVHG